MANERSSGIGKGCILVVFLGAVLLMIGVAAVAIPYMAMAPREVEVAPVVVTAEPAPAPEVGSTADVPAVDRSAAGPAVARIVARKTLLVGMDTGEPAWTGTPPMYFPNNRGEPDGFDMALANEIARSLGVEVKIIHGRYSELEGLLVDPSPKIDLLISGFVPTDTEGIVWSQPYLEFGLCLIVSSKSKIKTTKDLFGMSIGIFDDDAAAAEVSKLVKGYTELVRLEDGYWDQLVNGRFDAFIYDYPYAVAEIAHWYGQNPSRKGSLRIAQYNLTDSSYASGARATEPDLLRVVNETITTWRASESYTAAIRRYLQGGEAVAAPAVGKFVVVAQGETLSLIAARELGSVDRWPELWELNQSRFPNPHLIDVGDQVQLPN